MRLSLHPLALSLALSSLATSAIACSDEAYIGSICVTAASFCPAPNYMNASGQTLAIQQYAALYSLLGTTYGGNGQTTFQLPNLSGRVPVGTGVGPGLSNVLLGQTRGAESVTLTAANLPSAPVTVSVAVNPAPGAATSPADGHTWLGASAAGGPTAANMWSNAGTGTVNLSGVTGMLAGQGAATNNLPPQLGLTHCIAVNGLYPSRP